MKKMIRYSSPIANIDEIDLYVVNIKIHLICPKMYLIHLVNFYLIFYFGQGHFNIPRSVLYMRKLALNLLITASKSVTI